MKVRFLSSANIELGNAMHYYNQELKGLGYHFLQEIDATVERIKCFPDGWTKIGKQTRRCMLKGFPYALLYSVEDDEIIVLAVANLHRDPEHYKRLIK